MTTNGVLCDYKLESGKTCDRHCCKKCAQRIGSDVDFCPAHARLHMKQPPAERKL